jgi:hypothetical protein
LLCVLQEAVGDVDALKLANEHLELTLQRCAARADREVTSLRAALEAAQTEAEQVRNANLTNTIIYILKYSSC